MLGKNSLVPPVHRKATKAGAWSLKMEMKEEGMS
jgi:hypothetical protein